MLRHELATAVAGQGRVCLIGGEAGIGKTALVRELAGTAERLGCRILIGSCYDLANAPPYGPWLDLFEACQRDATLPPPPPAFAGGQLATITDQAALFADVRRFFSALASDRPLLVILEDQHWADPASLDLLRHVGPHLQHWPVLVLVTYRADALVRNLPFVQHLPALVREADGRRCDLHPLDAPALRALLTNRYPLPHDDEDRLASYLQRHAEGNPFFATEILRTLEGNGVLREREEGWEVGPLDRVVVPALLRQVIDARVIRLGDETRQALAVAAVIGHDVPLELWATVAGLPGEVLLDIVERAVDAHLIEAEPDGTRVRFVHALTREALYDGILPPRRNAWHGKTADALLASTRPDPDTVAFHLVEARDDRAVDWLIRAGERAQRAYAWLSAAERFRAAVTLLEAIDDREYTRRRLLVRIFYLMRFAYPASTISAMDEAVRLSRRAGDAFMIAETQEVRGVLLCYVDQFRRGLADLEEGIGAIEALPAIVQQTVNSMREWLSQAFTGQHDAPLANDEDALQHLLAARVDFRRSYQAWMLASAGRLDEALAIREQFAPLFDGRAGNSSGIRLVTAFTRHALAIAATAHGRPSDAGELWRQAREEFGDHHVLVAFTILDELRDLVLTYGANDPAARRRLAAEAQAALGRAGGALRPGVSPALAWLRCLLADGRWDEAAQVLGDMPDPGNAYLRRETTGTTVVLARYRGRPDVAWAQIRPLFPQGPATEPGNLILMEGLALQRHAAGLCLEGGDPAAATAWLSAHDRWLAWSGSTLGQADGQLAWGQYHHAIGQIDVARTCLDAALGLASEPEQPLVRLGAHRLLGEIDTAAGHLPEAEIHLAAALAMAGQCDVPFERAMTLLALAGLRTRNHEDAAAATVLEEARQVFVTLGAVPALARVDALAARIGGGSPHAALPLGLTAREMEVLRLVAEGRSNTEIAAALFISRETARTHVANIFRKLDVGTRAEAVDRAYRHHLLRTESAGVDPAWSDT